MIITSGPQNYATVRRPRCCRAAGKTGTPDGKRAFAANAVDTRKHTRGYVAMASPRSDTMTSPPSLMNSGRPEAGPDGSQLEDWCHAAEELRSRAYTR